MNGSEITLASGITSLSTTSKVFFVFVAKRNDLQKTFLLIKGQGSIKSLSFSDQITSALVI